jgi:hypothetical protein
MIMKELKRFQIMRRIELQDAEKIKPSTSLWDEDATRFNPPSLKDEAATPKAEQQVDLKKQTQSVPAQISVKSFVEGYYDNNPVCGVDENKANQSQFPAPEPTEGAGKREKSLAAANC